MRSSARTKVSEPSVDCTEMKAVGVFRDGDESVAGGVLIGIVEGDGDDELEGGEVEGMVGAFFFFSRVWFVDRRGG